ncbi:uncharacterized protein [Triticum aestivum]|uniref:uncharacterized protein isoform X2 n=1 Tax=Triticum aestivum TaxID=4565 RepID=UPI001D006317|nr:uncharacterized protein LOC123170075 isoform X2 [Triticum aestivum]
MGDEAVLESILNGEMGPTHMPFALLERITENFSEERKIGQGGFALVYKGIYNGEDIAVKKFYDVQTLDNKHFENECDKLIKIKHPNIVRLVGYCYETQHKYVEYKGVLQFAHHICRILCFEYLQGGSLENHLNESRDHDWPTCYNIIEGTCEALNFLHKGYGSRVLHLDLKPGNILLDKYMGAKVADFGLSTSFNKTRITNTTTGTEYYMAPEFKSKRVISPKNDVYSLGIIIIEIMAGRIGYKIFSAMGDDPQELFIEQVITNWRGRINATTSPFPSAELDQVETCIKIAIKCVDLNRKNRPTVAEILAAMQKTEKRFLAEWRNHAEFHVDESLPIPTKSESRGGSGGEVVDIKEHPWRLHSLTISYQGLIDAFSFSYIDQYGEKQHVGPWGEQHSYHKTETIRFSPSEFVEEVSGAYGSHFENLLVTSLTFVTNVRTYGPFGNPNHQNVAAAPLKFMADEGSSIVAFHGRSGSHLFSIGVYMYPNNKRKGRTLLAPVIPDGESLPNPRSAQDLPTRGGPGGIRGKPWHQRLTIRFAVRASICFVLLLLVSIWCMYRGNPWHHGLQVPEKLSNDSSAWYTVDRGIFWMVQEKLTHFAGSCMGYIYVMSTPNTYTWDMKVVDPADAKAGYTKFDRHRTTCTKSMASGLAKAHKMISSCGHHNSIILFFSDGLINKGDFFDGAENFTSEVPVHAFTLAGDAYNNVLHSIAENSPGGKFHTTPVPERPKLSAPFSKLLDILLGGIPKNDEKPPSPISGREPLDVVIVYAFDSTNSPPAWYTVDGGIFWLVQEKLTHFANSCMGYIYVMSTPNTYTSDMKVVDPAETKDTGYTKFDWRRLTCAKNMGSGLAEAHKMISNRGYRNGIILFFSDGLINEGDFFDGTENFTSKVPVHTFTLGGDAYNHGLQAIAANSPGGTFNPIPVPEKPHLSTPFSNLLDSLLNNTMKD